MVVDIESMAMGIDLHPGPHIVPIQERQMVDEGWPRIAATTRRDLDERLCRLVEAAHTGRVADRGLKCRVDPFPRDLQRGDVCSAPDAEFSAPSKEHGSQRDHDEDGRTWQELSTHLHRRFPSHNLRWLGSTCHHKV